VEADEATWAETARRIWELAEVGYQEHESSALLQTHLREGGFRVEAGVAGIPTAFVAEWGSGEPVVAILAEFDALPGITQDDSPERSPRADRNAGHACGHHLFGTGSVAAARAVKAWLESSGTAGTIRLYGTPAEEGGAGKVYMVRDGLFEDVDAVLHWHADDENNASPSTSLANKSAKFRFHGVSAHAAGAPERGRSALDGVEAMNVMVNMMREHVPEATRIHYVITSGGAAPNVIPDFAEVFYYVRHPESETVAELFERVVAAAEGAALGTGTTVEHEIIHGIYSLLPNEVLARVMDANLQAVGGVTYTDEEAAFASVVQRSFDGRVPALEQAGRVQPYELRRGGGSTDVGDVSWVVPTAGMRAATWVPGTAAHSWQAVAAGGTTIGAKGMMVAAKTLARTAVDLFLDPSLAQRAEAERRERVGPDYVYRALVGDRDPPLDYRSTGG
jgi:aminobenzoyl-glutamate utilization protein B